MRFGLFRVVRSLAGPVYSLMEFGQLTIHAVVGLAGGKRDAVLQILFVGFFGASLI